MESPYLEYLHGKYRFPRSLVHRPIHRFFRRHLEGLPAGTRVLDAGCGNGIETGPHADRLAVWGVDYQPAYVAWCRRTYPRGRWAVADLNRLCLGADRFGAVVLNQVVEHLEDPRRVIAECARVLAPGGRLLVATPNYGGVGWPLVEATYHRAYHRWFAGDFDAAENHVTRYRPEILRAQLASALVVESVATVCARLILVGVARKDAAGRACGARAAPTI